MEQPGSLAVLGVGWSLLLVGLVFGNVIVMCIGALECWVALLITLLED